MSAQATRQRNAVLFSSPHHLQPEVLSVDIIEMEDCLGVVCHDRHLRKSWRQRVSLCHVSSLIQRYYYNLQTLWGLLARSIVNTGTEISFSTQHIVNFHITRTSDRKEAYMILETIKACDDERWRIEFLSECEYPFTLELRIRKHPDDIHRYCCRIEQQHIVHLFDEHCLEPYKYEATSENGMEEFPLAPNTMMNAILEELFYDEGTDTFMVRFVEMSSLESYLDHSVQQSRNFNQALQQSIEGFIEETLVPEACSHSRESSAPPSLQASPVPSAPTSPRDGFALDVQNSLYEELQVPRLIDQINLENTFSHIPPPIDKLPRHSEVDGLADNMISQLSLPAGQGSPDSGAQMYNRTDVRVERMGSMSPSEFHSKERALEHPPASSTMASLVLPTRMFAPPRTAFSSQSRSPRSPRSPRSGPTETEVIEAELERSSTIVNAMNKAAATVARRKAAQLAATIARASLMVGNSRKAFVPCNGGLSSQISQLKGRNPPAARVLHTVKFDSDSGAEHSGDELSDHESDEEGSTCGFDEDERPSKQIRAAAISEKTVMRGKFMKKFTQSLFSGDKKAVAKAKIDEIVNQNKDLVKKAMAQETLKILDPAMNLHKVAQRVVPTGYADFPAVREALTIKPSSRSKASRDLIMDMLKVGCALSPYTTQCCPDDLRALSEASELREIRPKYLEPEPLHVRGEVALCVYIILQGTLKVTSYAEDRPGYSPALEGKVPPKEYRLLAPGDCVGEFILNGITSWNVDVNTPPTSHVSLCCIPMDVALRFIGRKGSDAEGAMVLFWKHHRLWQEIKQHNQDLLLHSKYKNAAAANPKKRQDIHFNFQPMNVIDAARIKVFQPGMDIFTQGAPRRYFYLMLRGCAEYRRAFPAIITEDGLMPPTVEVGLTLLCGDFSFMDGEDHLWIEQMQEMDLQASGSATESDRVRERRINKYCRFDPHKNSLVAVSRVEVVALPIHEVAKCLKLFQRLTRLATEKYPGPFIASEELVRQYYESEKWKIDRKEVIKDIVIEQGTRQLNENWFQNVNNNVADDWYIARKPGGTTDKSKSTLQMVLEAAIAAPVKNKNSAKGASDDPGARVGIQSTSKTEVCAENTADTVILNSPRRALLKNCLDYMTAEDLKTKAVLEMVDQSGKFDFSMLNLSFKGTTESAPHHQRETEPAPETLISPRPPLWQPRSVAPVHSHRRPQSASATHRGTSVEGGAERPPSAAAASTDNAGQMRVRNTDSPPLRRPQSAQGGTRQPSVRSVQLPQSASASGRSRPFSANLAVRASSKMEGSETTRGHGGFVGASPPRLGKLVMASPMPASSPRPHTTGSHRHLVEAHIHPQESVQASARPPPKAEPHAPVDRAAVSKKVVQFSKLLPEFDFSDFASGADEETAERREGSMKNPQFAEYDFTSAMLISASAKRQALREQELAANTPRSGDATGSRKVRLKQRVHTQQVKIKEIDPEEFVQAYRDKINDDPHKRFIDEFIKKM